MSLPPRNAPRFMIIGAQKAATTWLWDMLDQHPGTSLPAGKEIHYFGASELYARGDDWYYAHFRDLDPERLIGEASTSYFYDRVPYWFNSSSRIEYDESLPTIAELILKKFPEMKFIVVLRDPVQRAISAYSHWMKQGRLSPRPGLEKIALEHPKMRILEYGYYARWLETWTAFVPPERLRIIRYEDQIRNNWAQTLCDTYTYLGLDPDFEPELPSRPVHRSWGWTRILFNYYAGRISGKLGRSRIGAMLDRFDFLGDRAIKAEDIEFLRAAYLPEKTALQALTGNGLESWDYGEKLLEKLQVR